MSEYAIDVAACRLRQQRLLSEMQRLKLDLAVVTLAEHVQYFVGPRFNWHFAPAAAIDSAGRVTLIAPALAMPDVHAADEVRSYAAQWLCTLRNDQRQVSTQVLRDALAGGPQAKRVGVEFSACGVWISQALDAELVDIEPALYAMRRRKDPDELARIRKAIAATGAMYRRAREIIAPGVNELEVFSELQKAAVQECGEMLTGTGNDYACGTPGGPPRDRQILAGELYILDLGPAFRGYFADNCRAIAVDGRPTDEQQQLWQRIVAVQQHVMSTVRPGKSCKALFEEASEMLATDDLTLGHHLGHGIGLFPHEAPHLNPFWDDNFQTGEVFACEPGLYAPRFHGGIRLENNYLVTEDGVELLSDFPLEL